MRKIGTVDNPDHAQRLGHYFLSQDIEAKIERHQERSEVWILDEDRVDEARRILEQFLAEPEARSFDAPAPQARRKTHKTMVAHREFRVASARQAGIPLTISLVAVSVVVTLITNFARQKPELLEQIWLTDAWRTEGEIWRIFTPMFLHLSFMHLFFNMYWTMIFGGLIERLKGTFSFLGIVLTIAAFSHLVQFYWTGGRFGGMSGVGYGLFGYIWMRSRFFPWDGFALDSQTVTLWLMFFLLCLTGLLGPIANAAHFGGLVMGMAIGYAPKLYHR
ncbi:MAG: rhomboid family intramembrane serine protease [Planctomycetaceae bacterium]|nr:rhomboid family intramembrane serine protease [Planctomycetaceae bacterium]